MSLIDILFENNIKKSLYKDVLKFRKKEEKYYDWKYDKTCFKNTCQSISKELTNYLKKLNYNVKRVGGYYYPPEKWFKKYNEPYEDGKWKHWWVEVNNKYIVDITADQFHPNKEEDYRIVITNKNNSNYES